MFSADLLRPLHCEWGYVVRRALQNNKHCYPLVTAGTTETELTKVMCQVSSRVRNRTHMF